MSSTVKHGFGLGIVSALVVAMVACAQGQDTQVGDDDDEVDARVDSPQVIDGPLLIDARIIDAPQLIDAPGLTDGLPIPDDGTIGTCTTHAECGTGMCCFGMLMCIPGDPLPLPPPFDCLPS